MKHTFFPETLIVSALVMVIPEKLRKNEEKESGEMKIEKDEPVRLILNNSRAKNRIDF
jgi:hypothetical protein